MPYPPISGAPVAPHFGIGGVQQQPPQGGAQPMPRSNIVPGNWFMQRYSMSPRGVSPDQWPQAQGYQGQTPYGQQPQQQQQPAQGGQRIAQAAGGGDPGVGHIGPGGSNANANPPSAPGQAPGVAYIPYAPSYAPNVQQAQAQGAMMSWMPNAPSTNDIVSNIMQSLSPQFNQQDKALQESLADAGIVGGSTPGAVANLGLTQQQQALGAVSPYIMQGYQMQQNADQQNQNWMNQLQEFNAGQGLQTSEFNATNANQAQQYDINNLIREAMYNSGIYNTASSLGQQLSNTDWLAQLQANTALQEAGMGVQAGAFQPVFTQPAPVDFGNLASGLAPSGGGGGAPSSGYSFS